MTSRIQSCPTIALAESDHDDANLLLSALRHAAPNLNVDLLQNGEEVLQYFFRTDKRAAKMQANDIPCELLLLNLALPKLDGFKVLRQLQWLYREDLTQLPPVVVLCESDDPEIIATAYRYGARGFLCKSMAVSELVRAIEEVLHYWLEVTLRPTRERSRPKNRLRNWWPIGSPGLAQQELILR